MTIFEFLKPKRELPLPPPPVPKEVSMPKGDFENIRPNSDFPTAPAPAEEKEVPVFDKTIPQEAVENFVETVRPAASSAFIAAEDYKRIINDTNNIRMHLISAENVAKQLSDLKLNEERTLERWRAHLEDVEKKLSYVDKLIEKAEKV